MELVADLHTHSVASGHAYSTVLELAREAAAKGLKMLALTDHGPNMPGGPHLYHFYNITVIPEKIEGVEIIRGVEANIIDCHGNIDLPDDYLIRLDWVLAGFHMFCSPEGTREENTDTLIKAIENPRVDGIVHPGNPDYPIDSLRVIKAIQANRKVIEINNSSVRGGVRAGSKENCLRIARLAKEYGVQVMLNSDAHISFDVGAFEQAVEIAEQVGIKEENVFNASLGKIRKFMAQRNQERREFITKIKKAV